MLPGGVEEIEIFNNLQPLEIQNNKEIGKEFDEMIKNLFNSNPIDPIAIPLPKKNNKGLKPLNPFNNFEVMINGQKVTDPNEIKKDEEMFENMFDGFDFNFNP